MIQRMNQMRNQRIPNQMSRCRIEYPGMSLFRNWGYHLIAFVGVCYAVDVIIECSVFSAKPPKRTIRLLPPNGPRFFNAKRAAALFAATRLSTM